MLLILCEVSHLIDLQRQLFCFLNKTNLTQFAKMSIFSSKLFFTEKYF